MGRLAAVPRLILAYLPNSFGPATSAIGKLAPVRPSKRDQSEPADITDTLCVLRCTPETNVRKLRSRCTRDRAIVDNFACVQVFASPRERRGVRRNDDVRACGFVLPVQVRAELREQ